MSIEGSQAHHPVSPKREKLEDRFGKIAMPALAAAVGASRKEIDQRKANAEAAVTRLQQVAED